MRPDPSILDDEDMFAIDLMVEFSTLSVPRVSNALRRERVSENDLVCRRAIVVCLLHPRSLGFKTGRLVKHDGYETKSQRGF